MTIAYEQDAASEGGQIGWEMDECEAPEHPSNLALLDYYRTLPVVDGLPSRADVRPPAIVKLLNGMFVAHELPDGDFAYRLVGTEIEMRSNTSATGQRVSELYRTENLDEVLDSYRRVVHGHEMIVLRGHTRGLGIEHVQMEALMLPIRSTDGQVTQIIGGLFTFN